MRRKLSSVMVAVALSVVVTSAASADTGQAAFSATGDIVYVGLSTDTNAPTKTRSTFQYRHGVPSKVTVETFNEEVQGGRISVAGCESSTCDEVRRHLNSETVMTSRHSSTAVLNVTGIRNTVYTLPLPLLKLRSSAQVISGTISGNLGGTFTLENGQEQLDGTMDLGITGTADYICFSPLPGPYLPCTLGLGDMFPVSLDIVDDGTFTITGDGVAMEGSVMVDADVRVNLDKAVRKDPSAFAVDGIFSLTEATASFAEGGEGPGDGDSQPAQQESQDGGLLSGLLSGLLN